MILIKISRRNLIHFFWHCLAFLKKIFRFLFSGSRKKAIAKFPATSILVSPTSQACHQHKLFFDGSLTSITFQLIRPILDTSIFWDDSYKLYNDFIKKEYDERNWLSKFLKCDPHVPYLFLKNNQCINPINQSNPIILIPCWEPRDTQIHRLPNSHLMKKTSPKNHQKTTLFLF